VPSLLVFRLANLAVGLADVERKSVIPLRS
jgi:hypothetical protein